LQVRKRKWENYSSGEELFGLPVTPYPELEASEKEIQMLDRLYNLYVNVITTIKVRVPVHLWIALVVKVIRAYLVSHACTVTATKKSCRVCVCVCCA
jgi:hypothetical protein